MKKDPQTLQQKWQKVLALIQGLDPINRAIVFALLLLMVFAIFYFFIIWPASHRNKTLQQQTQGLESQIVTLSSTITSRHQQDMEYEQLKNKVADILKTNTGFFKLLLTESQEFSPNQFIQISSQLAKQQNNIEIVSVTQLPMTKTFESAATADTQQFALYQYSFDLVLKGDYFSLLNYLEQLSELGWPILFGGFSVKREANTLQASIQCDVLTMMRS